MTSPWRDIGVPASGNFNSRRIDGAEELELFWARNSRGQYAFLHVSNVPLPEGLQIPSLRGVSIHLENTPSQRQLQLVLERTEDHELFHALCMDLIDAAGRALAQDVVPVIIGRLLRWQRFMGRSARTLLDESERIGLVGELLFLRDELLPRYGERAIMFWEGPAGGDQDFCIRDTVYEVKTQTGTVIRPIRISLPEQLWPGMPNMYLVLTRLGPAGSGTAGIDLRSLVNQISDLLLETATLELFEERLQQAGYLPLADYDQYVYGLAGRTFFKVREGFPRLPLEAVPSGVVDVRYSIEPEACRPFQVTPEWPDSVEEAA